MTTRKSSDTHTPDRLPGEAELARMYRAAPGMAPPASLDSKILAEARRAVARPVRHGRFGSRWAIPLSTAAVMILTLGVLLVVSEQSPLDRRDEIAPVLNESPALSAPAARPASPAPPTAQAVGKADVAESAPSANGVLQAAPEAKKTERAATTATPAPRRENIADERVVGSAQGEVRAKAKLAKEATVRTAANVISVQVSGAPGAYQFDVTVQSPDSGCAQYADWWEVVSADGKLLYRRVLAHSHVNEQPFTRSGGPVALQPETVVWVRAHMSTSGYGGAAFKGSVMSGFAKAEPPANFAAGIAKLPPLPEGCAF